MLNIKFEFYTGGTVLVQKCLTSNIPVSSLSTHPITDPYAIRTTPLAYIASKIAGTVISTLIHISYITYVYTYFFILEVKDHLNNSPQFWMIQIPYQK